MLYINATILDDKPTGLGVYTKNVLKYLNKDKVSKIIIKENYFKTFINEFNYNENSISTINCQSRFNLNSTIMRNYKYNYFVKNECKFKDIILYSPTHHGVLNKNIKQIITIHDILPLLFPRGRMHQYIYYKYVLPHIINHSDKIITVSNNTKNDIMKYYNVSEEKIAVIYNGFDRPKYIDKIKSAEYIYNKYGIKDYILMVGINYRYKNLHNVIYAYNNIYKKINNSLIIVGNFKNNYGNELKKIIEKLKLKDKVIFLGYIPDMDKHLIYQAAKLFIYPSLYEGFGLPVLEAMANETPTICSNTSSLVEVSNNMTLNFDPYNIKDIENSILKMLSLDEKAIKNLIIKYKYNIDRFSWEKCVSDIEKIIYTIR